MKKTRLLYRQGDLLVEQIAELPEGLKQQKPASDGTIILARGEATGHHHSLVANESADWWKHPDNRGDGDDQFISLTAPATLKHQEHSSIVLAPGSYRVRRQREYSPDAIKRVAD